MKFREFYTEDERRLRKLVEVFSKIQRAHVGGSMKTFQFTNLYFQLVRELEKLGHRYIPYGELVPYTFVRVQGRGEVGYVKEYISETQVVVVGELQGVFRVDELVVERVAL